MDGISRGTNAAFQKGQQIGQYQIVEVLAPTRFGHLYLGQHIHQPTQQVLIEGLLTPLLDEFKEDFLKRAQALRTLEHPHILRVQALGVQQHYPFLVTDYLPYHTFSQVYAPKSTQSLLKILPHLMQIASALQYAHSQSILHGDLRPENLLLGEDNEILLRGFLLEAIMQNRGGLNYRGEEAVEHEAMIYAAPEQIQGKIGAASDQYALGVLIYELFCGEAPFTGSSVEIAFQKIHASVPSMRQKRPNLISPDVEQVVMRALEKEPGKRFPDIQAFVDALEQAQNQPSRDPASTVSVQPTVIITPPLVASPVISSPAPIGISSPVLQVPPPPPRLLAETPDLPTIRIQEAPPLYRSNKANMPSNRVGTGREQAPFPTVPARQPVPATDLRIGTVHGSPPTRFSSFGPDWAPPDGSPEEPLGKVPLEFQHTVTRQVPLPSEPPARRPEDVSVTRRVLFAIGLVSVAALGGAGGWYLLSPRFARTAPPVVSSNTGPLATQVTIDNQKALIFTGHLASVNALAWSPDGNFIASASDDTFVQVFESTTGRRKSIYRGHTEEVAAVAWSPNGHLIASAGQDQTVQVWDAASGASVLTYKGHADRVNSVSWSSNGSLLASCSDDKSVQVWSASTGGRTFTFQGHTAGVLCVSWQPDDSSIASGSWDGTLRDWATVQHGNHFNAGEQIFKYGGHGNAAIYALAWSPDSNFIVSAGADQTVQISNGGDGTPRLPFFADHRRTDHVNRVFAVSWSPDGTSIASGDEDGNVYVWRTTGRKTFFKYSGHKGAVNAIAWSPDSKFIASASADNTVHIWQP